MNLNERMEKFLIKDNGIENIFKSVGWLAASSGVFSLSFLLESIVTKIVTIIISLFLFTLVFLWSIKKTIIPFLQATFGEKEKYSDMVNMSFKQLLKECQFWFYLIICLLYCLLVL
ncbi:hypothetical protein [Thermodesulfovibrio yellowstonii]|uniref:Uncharacterized protein n=1 Tax=Thermodesulfovibrio yellowstonii TaxID=28262 RepID=A0A9W6GGF0_9BACT|nr:hypothetical protein [Thermodesulfovibrio islandicus]GLI53505.1 hypothetical protein TISLANDTSLP1_11980 [Thermodesulfovibrio islandicus]